MSYLNRFQSVQRITRHVGCTLLSGLVKIITIITINTIISESYLKSRTRPSDLPFPIRGGAFLIRRVSRPQPSGPPLLERWNGNPEPSQARSGEARSRQAAASVGPLQPPGPAAPPRPFPGSPARLLPPSALPIPPAGLRVQRRSKAQRLCSVLAERAAER